MGKARSPGAGEGGAADLKPGVNWRPSPGSFVFDRVTGKRTYVKPADCDALPKGWELAALEWVRQTPMVNGRPAIGLTAFRLGKRSRRGNPGYAPREDIKADLRKYLGTLNPRTKRKQILKLIKDQTGLEISTAEMDRFEDPVEVATELLVEAWDGRAKVTPGESTRHTFRQIRDLRMHVRARKAKAAKKKETSTSR